MLDATYPFVLPPLPYPYDALEPYIDAETMHYHYDKHFGGYIDNLNKALEPYPFLQGLTLEQLLAANRMLPAAAYTAIMHNGGGVYNHAIYFSRLCPPGQGGGRRPAGKLLDEISVTFGSFDKFKQELSDHAKNVFGSGWSSLVITREGSLRIVDLFNQQTVAGTGAEVVTLIDVWEHAYYLKYKNLRADYIENIWNLLTYPDIAADPQVGFDPQDDFDPAPDRPRRPW